MRNEYQRQDAQKVIALRMEGRIEHADRLYRIGEIRYGEPEMYRAVRRAKIRLNHNQGAKMNQRAPLQRYEVREWLNADLWTPKQLDELTDLIMALEPESTEDDWNKLCQEYDVTV
jgi:hypothetical protein